MKLTSNDTQNDLDVDGDLTLSQSSTNSDVKGVQVVKIK